MELYLEVVEAVKSQLNMETVKNRTAFSGRVGKHENSVRIVLKCHVCKKKKLINSVARDVVTFALKKWTKIVDFSRVYLQPH